MSRFVLFTTFLIGAMPWHSLLLADERIEIVIDQGVVLFANISEPTVEKIMKYNGFSAPSSWPVYENTGHPDYEMPQTLIRRAKKHPEWEIDKLARFRVGFFDSKAERTVLFYRRSAGILIILNVALDSSAGKRAEPHSDRKGNREASSFGEPETVPTQAKPQ